MKNETLKKRIMRNKKNLTKKILKKEDQKIENNDMKYPALLLQVLQDSLSMKIGKLQDSLVKVVGLNHMTQLSLCCRGGLRAYTVCGGK